MKRTEKVSADSWRLGELRYKEVKSRCAGAASYRAAELVRFAEPGSKQAGNLKKKKKERERE